MLAFEDTGVLRVSEVLKVISSPRLSDIRVTFPCQTPPAAPPSPPPPPPFAAVAELDLMFSGYDTSQLPPSRAASSSSSALHNTVCVLVCVCACVTERDRHREW